ncbi:hypothetical protein F5X99DRAFT_212692 [Biscogniauxia marginata]|nr:hypothetical protein F5X99DRAFT_212692 [Biscogniauxia marginata]
MSSSSSPSQPQPQPQPPSPPQAQTQVQAQQKPGSQNANPFIHNVALGVTPVALGALFLPPRRLDLRAAILGSVALWGTNQLASDYSGRSFAQRVSARAAALSAGTGIGMGGAALPEAARATQARIREERRARELQQQQRRQEEERQQLGRRGGGEEGKEAGKEGGKGKEGDSDKNGNLLRRIWMGDQSDDWKKERDRREKEALSEGGGGYWGLITEQIWEVWNQGSGSGSGAGGGSGADSSKDKDVKKDESGSSNSSSSSSSSSGPKGSSS